MADNVPPQTSQDPNTEAQAFPERIRVHALAKLLGVTSKQVVAQLAEMGVDVRSVQSSVVRADAETVASALGGSVVTQSVTPEAEAEAVVEAEPAPAAARVEPDLFTNIETTEATAPSTAGPASVPVFLQPEAAPEAPKARRRARSPKKVETPATETPGTETPAGETPATETPAAETPVVEAPAAETPSPEVPTLEVPADASDEAANDQDTAESAEQESNDQDGQSGPRRRRRGRRGRGRGRGDAQTDDQDDSDDDSDESSTDAVASDQPTDETSTSDETSTDSEATPDADASESQDDDTEDAAEASPRRSSNRRSRSRRSARSESSATDESTPGDAPESDTSDDADSAESAEGDDDESTADSASRRRRRRRRRKSGADSADGDATTEDDPPNTVVHEREPRQRKAKDEVQGITGSTRLEAKRQRRRDGRDAGRRRPPILTESEFLARRESVDRTMVVREKALAGQPDLTQVAVLEDGVLVEHFVTSTASGSIVGNVYLGRVQNVLPSMEAAFIDIGKGRNGVLYAGEVDWDAAGLGGNSRKIEQALKPGDQVLVQVSKDPVGHKGARLTTQISLAGRFLVYVPGGSSTGISRKLPDNERKRLKDILRDIVPAEAGVIIRTASEGVSAEELARDVTRLQAQWAMVSERSTGAESAKGSAPVTLYEEPDLLVKVVRDLFNEDFSKLVIEGDRAWSTVQSYIETVAPDMLSRVERYTSSSKDVDVFAAYRIDEQLAKALDRKVWLPSGGTLVIDRTEAMTVVDVNTGKFTGEGGNLEETVTRNNLEAAEEVVRQMRLRDIGGMIVVDFIDMVLESNRDLVLRRLTEALGRDRTRHQVSEVTSLGLVQMTRKRMGTGLIEAFSTTCEHCHGRGLMMHQFPVEAAKDDGGRGNSRSDNSRSDNNQRSDNSRSDNNQRSEGGSRRRRGGKDRSDSRPQDAVDTGASEDDTTDTTVDPSIRRAHPVALAMAAHLHPDDVADSGSDPIDEAAAAVAAVRDARTAPDESPATDVSSDTAPVDVPDETVVEPDAAAAPATRPRRSRRVSRAASAPAGDSAGTVIVVPSTPVNGSAAAVSEDSAPAVVEEPAAVTVGGGASVAAAAPARRPRRRAAGRPAGPPPGDES